MEEQVKQIILYEPEEQLKSILDVYANITLDGAKYFLAAVHVDEEDEDPDLDETEEEDGVFIFQVCDAIDSEFQVLKEDGTTDYYVTTDIGKKTDRVIEAFQALDEDFDLLRDEE